MDRMTQMERPDRIDGNGAWSHDERLARDVAAGRDDSEPGIGELFKRVSADLSSLAHQEFQLAKAELKESVDQAKRSSVMFIVAVVFALPGMMAIAACLVIVLANVMGSWWAASLVVGIVLLAIAALIVKRAIAGLTDGSVGLQETAASLGEDARWGKQELKAFKRELTA